MPSGAVSEMPEIILGLRRLGELGRDVRVTVVVPW
jgi:hypothetical protein